jgi:hypothetical protein
MLMSAFIVENRTINTIVTGLGHEFRKNSSLRRVAEKFRIDVESNGWEQRLAEAMYQLNVEAVNQRYNEKNTSQKFVHNPYPYHSRIAAFKSLQCWLYQCSEGNVPETTLYHYFAELEKELAISIVINLPQYEQAQWG